MRTEQEIKLKLEEWKKKYKASPMESPARSTAWHVISALEWVLEQAII